MGSKVVVCFPYTLTDQYDKTQDMQKLKYDYVLDHEATKATNKYNVTETLVYTHHKEHLNQTRDLKYKEAYESSKGHNLGTEETPEMSLARDLKPIQSKKAYEEAAKASLQRNHVGADGHQISHCLDMTLQASDLSYKAEYNEDILGKGVSDPAIAYPEHDRLKKIKDITKKKNYEKEARKVMETISYPIDAPEFVRATNSAENSNDRIYQKQRKEVIANYRGYQTMDSRDHPDVVRGKKASGLTSNKKYKADYEDSKIVVCFPYTLTDHYNKVRYMQNLKPKSYQEDHESTKCKNKFNITLTPIYEHNKEVTGVVSNVTYNSEYQKSRGHNLGVDITPEMVRAKDLKPIQSKQEYELAAKMALAKHHGTADGQAISHCLDMTLQASVLQYKTEYNEYILGKGASNPAISYPEHDRLKKIKDATKKQNYEKEARKETEWNIYHKDSPEFLRANNAAEIANDRIYKKQRNEVIAKYRGYQTMDSRDHPEVTRAKKANDLISSIKYKKDYEDSREVLCFPYTLTDVYDKIKDMQKLKYDYILDHENTKAQNKYNMAESQLYAKMKEHYKMSSDLAYKEAYENNKGKMLGTDVTPEMSLAKNMKPIQSKQAYELAAKIHRATNHLAADGQEISHAVAKQHLASKSEYKSEYTDGQVGKPPTDVAISYPEHQLHKIMQLLVKKPEYIKEARKMLEINRLSTDAPQFTLAKDAADQLSDIEYKKKGKEISASCRGLQTLETKHHPVVKRGTAAFQLNSMRLYTKEWDTDKKQVYYPVTFTPGYESLQKAAAYLSQKVYGQEASEFKEKPHFKYTETDKYKADKSLESVVNDRNYVRDYLKQRELLHPIENTSEMTISKMIAPLISQKAYSLDARRVMQKYNLDAGTKGIVHCMNSQ